MAAEVSLATIEIASASSATSPGFTSMPRCGGTTAIVPLPRMPTTGRPLASAWSVAHPERFVTPGITNRIR